MEIIENEWIRMSDGCRLASKLWIPEDARSKPVPAILEYIPYRKRDHKSIRDSQIYTWLARHGYAGVRVDLRGSGDSEGVLTDEYLQQELDDGLEIIRWIASQPWCAGDVGMLGLSWGGFNGLQIAALAPPELKAVVSVCSSDDRYTDDVHYMGGCHLTDNASWASTMFLLNSCPPDPLVAGENWRDMWLERLEGSGLWIKNWLEHQKRDEFWKHASVCESYETIKAPVFVVSGWADGYSNTVFRLMEHLKVPVRGLVGPWEHIYPHLESIEPAIDFLGECLKWYDRWLKNIQNGIDEEPPLRVWMQDSSTPLLPRKPGHWVAESKWPSSNVYQQEYFLAPMELHRHGLPCNEDKILTIQSPLSVGLYGGKWASYASATDLPWDQREADGGSLTFETEPLEDDVFIFGAPEVELEVAANKPQAMVAVRLSDVSPHDCSTRVTYGILNLSHRENHEQPRYLKSGKFYAVRVPMNYVAQRFPRGNRIRLSISSAYWPLAWPPPEDARLTLKLAKCRLLLPERQPQDIDRGLRPLGYPQFGVTPPFRLLVPAKKEWNLVHNLRNNEVALEVENNDAFIHLEDIDLSLGRESFERYSYHHNNFDTVHADISGSFHFKRAGWTVTTQTKTVVTSTRTHFRISATLDAYEGEARIFSKTWNELIVRDHM